mgnify:CR=1 FL=1
MGGQQQHHAVGFHFQQGAHQAAALAGIQAAVVDQDAAAAIAVNAVGAPQAGAAFLDLGTDQAMAFKVLADFLGL